jgi:hypothetical protein
MSVAMLDPVDQWSEVDEDYVDFPVVDDDTDVDEDEDLTAEEESIPEDTTPVTLFWASYELWGRNLDAATPWDRLAVEDFDGELNVEVEGLTAGASWEFRIRLIDSNGRYSPFSTPLQISLPTDFTPPPAPVAPFVAENMGQVTYGWTGELQGPIPEDFSHVIAYGRQMHPAGDPEGEPGDPFRLGRFTGEGYTSTGQLEHDVEHEIWLTAVDTTGNESPWSPAVSVTPSRPVDAEAIRQELDEAQDRLDQAEADYAQVRQDLDDGLADLNDVRLPALEQDITDAQQAVTDAQTRLDAAEQAVADSQEGLDDLRDVRIPGLEQDIQDGIEDADVRIRRLAVTGSSTNIITDPYFQHEWGTDEGWKAVEGASDGDFLVAWWRSRYTYIVRTSDRTGEWLYLRDGEGRMEAMPGGRYRFDARQFGTSDERRRLSIRVGYLDVDGVTVWAPEGEHVFPAGITNGGHLSFEWTVPDDASIRSMFFQIGFYADSESGWIGFYNPELREKTPGTLIVDGSILARHIMAESVAAAVAEFLELHADQITAGTINTARLNVSDLSAQIATIIELNADRITTGQLGADRISVASLFADSAFLNELAAEVVNAIDITAETAFIRGELLVNGAVTAEKITVTEQLTAEIANFLEVNADHLAANAIDGMEITGATFRTATNLAGSTSPGGVIIDSDASRGNIRVYAAGGDQVAAIGGDENWFRGHIEAQSGEFHGDVTADSLDLQGALTVGGGEGALRPSGSLLRLEGRMPSVDGARDMIVQGNSTRFTTSGGAMQEWDVVYDAPVPTGNRRPIVSSHIAQSGGEAVGDGNVTTSSFARTGSGFRTRTQPLFSSGSQSFWVYYIAIWAIGV